MSRYEVLLLLHIAAVIAWLGAALTLDVLMYRAERVRDRRAQLDLYAQMEWLANRLFIPSSLVVLVAGILLVLDGPWTFGQLWIVLGLAGYAASFVVGILYFKPESERIGTLVRDHGPDHPELDSRMHRMNVIGRVELGVLFLVVAVMVVKPTADDMWTLVILAAAAALTLAAGARSFVRARHETVAEPIPEPR